MVIFWAKQGSQSCKYYCIVPFHLYFPWNSSLFSTPLIENCPTRTHRLRLNFPPLNAPRQKPDEDPFHWPTIKVVVTDMRIGFEALSSIQIWGVRAREGYYFRGINLHPHSSWPFTKLLSAEREGRLPLQLTGGFPCRVLSVNTLVCWRSLK